MSTDPTTEFPSQPKADSFTSEAQPSQDSTSSAGGEVHPPTQPPPPPTRDSGDQAEPKYNSWEICLGYARGHAQREIKLWEDEVGNLLTFASIFSAVVGAFAIESYHNVQQDPADTTVLLLKSLLVLQLNATNPQPNLVIDLDPQVPISSAAKRINIYNFLSLILSLSVVMGGILCLQWLREYGQDPDGTPASLREHLGIRFMRQEGMKNWRVFTILRALPLILLLSLLLFFVGIIELSAEIDKAATIVTSIAIGIAVLFMAITTVLPMLQIFGIPPFPNHSQCPYKSPQAWILYQSVAAPVHWFTRTISKFTKQPLSNHLVNVPNWSWYDWSVYTRGTDAISNIGLGLHWLGGMYLQIPQFARALYYCIQDESIHGILHDILIMKDRRRANSVQEALDWIPPPAPYAEELTKKHIADVTVFQTFAHLADKIEQGHPTTVLVKERLQLFLRINEQHPDKDIDCPMVATLNIISGDTRKALLYYISRLMEDRIGVNESHLYVLNNILGLELDMPHPDLELFTRTHQTLQDWIEHEGWDTDEEPGTNKPKLTVEALRLRNRIDILRRLAASRHIMAP